MKTFKVLAGACAVLLTAGVAHAAPVALDFSTLGLSFGQSVEGSTFGVATFTSELGGLIYQDLFGDGGLYDFNSAGASGDVTITFAGGVSSVYVRAHDGGGDFDAFAISAYALGTDAFLGSFSSPLFDGTDGEHYTLLVSGLGPIGRIVFDPGNSGSLPGTAAVGGGVIITDVGFDTLAVPEPATPALLGLGLLIRGACRRRPR